MTKRAEPVTMVMDEAVREVPVAGRHGRPCVLSRSFLWHVLHADQRPAPCRIRRDEKRCVSSALAALKALEGSLYTCPLPHADIRDTKVIFLCSFFLCVCVSFFYSSRKFTNSPVSRTEAGDGSQGLLFNHRFVDQLQKEKCQTDD